MATQDYNKTGMPMTKIGNWEEERLMFSATQGLGAGDEAKKVTMKPPQDLAATQTRVFPNVAEGYDASSHFVTTHKTDFRRELHAPHPIVDASGRVATLNPHLPRREDKQRAALLEQAKQLYEQQQAALAAACAPTPEEIAELNNPFSGRAPMNRKRVVGDVPALTVAQAQAALSQPAVTVWSANKAQMLATGQTLSSRPAVEVTSTSTPASAIAPLASPHAFNRSVEFSRPIEDYKGTSKWQLTKN